MTVKDNIVEVIGLLNQEAQYAVLRNFEGLPGDNASRDIDIIITKESFLRVKPKLVDIFEKQGWSIVTYLNSDRLVTFVIAQNDGDDTEILQWDFFFNTSVYGIMLMDASEFVKYRKFNGFLWYCPEDVQFLDKYLYNRAVGKPFPAKYGRMREAAETSEVVRDKLRSVFGINYIAEGDAVNGPRLLRRALWHDFKVNPLGMISGIIMFLCTYIRNYWESDTGFTIGFTGPDGAGKTTVIDGMIERFGAVFRKAHVLYHFRPTLFGNISDVAHSAGLKKSVDRDYAKPHRGGKVGVMGSLARLCYYSADYIIGWFLKVKPVTRITRLAIFDRYYTDIICDSRRSRIFLSPRFLYYWGRVFIPSLDYNILLTASTSNILSRKRELDANDIEAINARIDFLSEKKGYYKILNDGSASEAINKILDIVFAEQNRKNLKRLG